MTDPLCVWLYILFVMMLGVYLMLPLDIMPILVKLWTLDMLPVLVMVETLMILQIYL